MGSKTMLHIPLGLWTTVTLFNKGYTEFNISQKKHATCWSTFETWFCVWHSSGLTSMIHTLSKWNLDPLRWSNVHRVYVHRPGLTGIELPRVPPREPSHVFTWSHPQSPGGGMGRDPNSPKKMIPAPSHQSTIGWDTVPWKTWKNMKNMHNIVTMPSQVC